MKFKKYQHVERYGTKEVEGIDCGMCYIFPKIDGTNSSLWMDDKLCAGSRNRELSEEKDNAGFFSWAKRQNNILKFFEDYPKVRLYGEWLVPHSLKTYRDEAWRKFYVFDFMSDGEYDNYEKYSRILEKYDIDYIPAMCKIKNPTYDKLIEKLKQNSFLIKNGEGFGEGLVIKNYEYENWQGRKTWAKIVSSEFKDKHSKVFGVNEIAGKKSIEENIVSKYVTDEFVDKEYQRIKSQNGGFSSSNIMELLSTVFYCLVKEECWEFVKKNKFPIINFKRLQGLVTQKVKEVKKELFIK